MCASQTCRRPRGLLPTITVQSAPQQQPPKTGQREPDNRLEERMTYTQVKYVLLTYASDVQLVLNGIHMHRRNHIYIYVGKWNLSGGGLPSVRKRKTRLTQHDKTLIYGGVPTQEPPLHAASNGAQDYARGIKGFSSTFWQLFSSKRSWASSRGNKVSLFSTSVGLGGDGRRSSRSPLEPLAVQDIMLKSTVCTVHMHI